MKFLGATPTDADDVATVAQTTTPVPVEETTTARTLSAADHGRVIWCTNAGLTTITVEDFATVPLPDGFWTVVIAGGAAGVTFDVSAVSLLASVDLSCATGEWMSAVALDASADLWAVGGGTAT